MTSALISCVGQTVSVGAISYVFCRAFNQQNAFEKVVLATVSVGLGVLAKAAITHVLNDKYQSLRLTRVLIYSANLLTIPCIPYAGRVFNFKAVDYLQIVGLSAIGNTVYYCLITLYETL